MNLIVAIFNAFQSVLMSHTQIYPHNHPHVDVSATQDAGFSLAFVLFIVMTGMLGSSILGYFVGKSVVSRRYVKK